jgi:hypothetical protein
MKPHTHESWMSLVNGGVAPKRDKYFHYSKYGEHYGQPDHRPDQNEQNMPILKDPTWFNILAGHTWG